MHFSEAFLAQGQVMTRSNRGLQVRRAEKHPRKRGAYTELSDARK